MALNFNLKLLVIKTHLGLIFLLLFIGCGDRNEADLSADDGAKLRFESCLKNDLTELQVFLNTVRPLKENSQAVYLLVSLPLVDKNYQFSSPDETPDSPLIYHHQELSSQFLMIWNELSEIEKDFLQNLKNPQRISLMSVEAKKRLRYSLQAINTLTAMGERYLSRHCLDESYRFQRPLELSDYYRLLKRDAVLVKDIWSIEDEVLLSSACLGVYSQDYCQKQFDYAKKYNRLTDFYFSVKNRYRELIYQRYLASEKPVSPLSCKTFIKDKKKFMDIYVGLNVPTDLEPLIVSALSLWTSYHEKTQYSLKLLNTTSGPKVNYYPDSENSYFKLSAEKKSSSELMLGKNSKRFSGTKIVAHEIGHALGFPDCYVEYITNSDKLVYYELDKTNIMCSIFSGRASFDLHFSQLIKICEDSKSFDLSYQTKNLLK